MHLSDYCLVELVTIASETIIHHKNFTSYGKETTNYKSKSLPTKEEGGDTYNQEIEG